MSMRTESQRAAIAAELAKFKFGENQHTTKEGASIEAPSPVTQEKAAQLLNVSCSSVQRAKVVKEADPELHAKVKAGEVSLNAAVKAVKPEPEPEPTSEPEISRVAPKTSGEEDISINTKGMTLLGMLLV